MKSYNSLSEILKKIERDKSNSNKMQNSHKTVKTVSSLVNAAINSSLGSFNAKQNLKLNVNSGKNLAPAG